MNTNLEILAYFFLKTRFRENAHPKKDFIKKRAEKIDVTFEEMTTFFDNFFGKKETMTLAEQYFFALSIVRSVFEEKKIDFTKTEIKKIADAMKIQEEDILNFFWEVKFRG